MNSRTDSAVRCDPYGTAISNTSAPLASGNSCATGTTQNDEFYRSGRRDAMTGAYQLGTRTYSPPQAGFLTLDTYQGPSSQPQPSTGTDPLTANTYTYVNGDPINLADPSGHHPICGDPSGTEGACESSVEARSQAAQQGQNPNTSPAVHHADQNYMKARNAYAVNQGRARAQTRGRTDVDHPTLVSGAGTGRRLACRAPK